MAEPAYTSTQVNGKDPIHELSHRGFSSCILIDDTPVQIYRPEYETFTGLLAEPLEDKRIMTGWIASEEGKTFSVAFKNDEGEDAEHASCAHILIDGKDVASAISRPHRQVPVVRHGAKVSPTVIKPFTFSKLQLTDDDDLAQVNDPRAQDIGTIVIQIKYVRLGEVVPLKPCDAEDIGVVHERAKKAGVHTTTYKTTKRVDKGRARSTAPLYPDDEWPHHIVFKFRYRPRDILMAEGYIPRPEQAKEEAEEIPDDDDDDAPVHTEDRKRLFIDDDDDENDEASAFKRMKAEHQPSSEDDGGAADSPVEATMTG